MKSIVLILSLVAMTLETSVFTQEDARGDERTGRYNFGLQQEDKTKIKKEELPEAARKTLEGDAFKGWTVSNAYKLKSGEFEVELKKDEVIQTIKFDKEGKVKEG